MKLALSVNATFEAALSRAGSPPRDGSGGWLLIFDDAQQLQHAAGAVHRVHEDLAAIAAARKLIGRDGLDCDVLITSRTSRWGRRPGLVPHELVELGHLPVAVARYGAEYRVSSGWAEYDGGFFGSDPLDARFPAIAERPVFGGPALPAPAIRPYVPRSCCFDVAPALPDAGAADSADLPLLSAYSPIPPTLRLTVTFRDQRQFQDYRAGLVQLVDAALVLLLRVLVVLLAALAHRTRAPVYLLVLLSTVRHYGHRSEPDHQPLPACALTFQRGSVRLTA
jgi:hypothetical protein